MRVEHDTTRHRFSIALPDGEAELSYVDEGKVLDLVHTFVPPGHRGEGIGEALVEEALAHARSNGLQVRPSCPYVRSWLEEHPEAGEGIVERA